MERRGRASQAPADALSATGVRGAECPVEMATASTPRKNAVRKTAPRLPGSSYTECKPHKNGEMSDDNRMLTMPSRRRTKGYLETIGLYLT